MENKKNKIEFWNSSDDIRTITVDIISGTTQGISFFMQEVE